MTLFSPGDRGECDRVGEPERSVDANDALAECTLQLADLFYNVQMNRKLNKVDRQWYTCTHPLYSGVQAKLELSIFMLPSELADNKVEYLAGHGRSEPNQNPHLEPPEREGGQIGNLLASLK